ncbi:MAG: antibiotic biosynthesis monooxygenase [Methylocystis silviterrae]|uniref:antibiotic biosynthesis monooxygenase n=1 Tax=Methylocystis silviterrae TaxID=2743612 RepID=UPI003C74A61C
MAQEMAQRSAAAFFAFPQPTVFVVNVIHVHVGRQDEAFRIIRDIVHYVAERKKGFLWSSLAKSTDGQTVVNVEAISGAGDVQEFFSDPVFAEKFERLKEVSTFEFHTYQVDDIVLPKTITSDLLAAQETEL